MPSLATGLGQGFAGLASGMLQGRADAWQKDQAAREMAMKAGYLDIAKGNYDLGKRQADLTYQQEMEARQLNSDVSSAYGGDPLPAVGTPPGPGNGSSPTTAAPAVTPAAPAAPAGSPAAPPQPAGFAGAAGPGPQAAPAGPPATPQSDGSLSSFLSAGLAADEQAYRNALQMRNPRAAAVIQGNILAKRKAVEDQKAEEVKREMGHKYEDLRDIVGLVSAGAYKPALDKINSVTDGYGRPLFGGNVTDIKQVGSYEKDGAIMPVFQTTTSDGQTHRIDAGALMAMAQTTAKDQATVLKNTEDYLVGQGKNEAEMARAMAERITALKPTDFQFAFNQAMSTNGGNKADALKTAGQAMWSKTGGDVNAALKYVTEGLGLTQQLEGLTPAERESKVQEFRKVLGLPSASSAPPPAAQAAPAPAAAAPQAAPAPAPPPATAPAAPKSPEQQSLEDSLSKLGIPVKKQAKLAPVNPRRNPFGFENAEAKRRKLGFGMEYPTTA